MTEAIATWFNETLGGFLPMELLVLLVSMLPILELRGGMIVASLCGLPLWEAFAIFRWMKQWKIFRPLVEKLEKHATGEKSQRIRKVEFWGLMLFVGVPLPGTGAWTGCLIAALLNVDKKKATLAAILGVLIASVIMALFSYGLVDAVLNLF